MGTACVLKGQSYPIPEWSSREMTISSYSVRCSKPHFLELFQRILSTLCLHIADQKHVPCLLTEMHTSLRCTTRHTLQIRTPIVSWKWDHRFQNTIFMFAYYILHVLPIQTVTWFTRHVLCVLRVLFIDKWLLLNEHQLCNYNHFYVACCLAYDLDSIILPLIVRIRKLNSR